MVAKLIVLLAVALVTGLVNCSPNNAINLSENQSEVCTRQEMEEMALKYLKKKSVLPTEYKVTYDYREGQRATEVQIIPKDPAKKGGGGKFLFLIQTCEMIKVELYQ